MKAILFIVLLVIVLTVIVWVQFEILKVRADYKNLMDEVKTFSYFVGNCNITPENKEEIVSKIKMFRKKNALYASKEYSDLLTEIATLYYKRFLKKD